MERQRKPEWLRINQKDIGKLGHVSKLVTNMELNTVCQAANCPNRLECFAKNRHIYDFRQCLYS